MPPLVLDIANNYRAALLHHDAVETAEMARRWLLVEAQIRDSLEAFAAQMERDGVTTPWRLSRMARYQRLRREVQIELQRYALWADSTITEGQRFAMLSALDSASASIQASAYNTFGIQFDRLPVSSVERMVGMAGNGTPLRRVLEEAARRGPDLMAQQLVNGVALGLNPLEVARRAMRLGLGQTFSRIRTIARTEQLRVYRETTRAAYQVSGVVTHYVRHAAKDANTCPACLFADGQRYALNESFDAHPNCRCALLPVLMYTPMPTLETGREWFARQPDALQLQMLGPTRYEAWKDGRVTLGQMVERHYDPTWGGSLRLRPVRDLVNS